MRKVSVVDYVIGFVLFLLTLSVIVPLFGLFVNSLKSPVGNGFSLINYKIVLGNKIILPSIWNSVFITLVGTVINIFLTVTSAYCLTRKGFAFKKIIMFFLIVMMLFDPGLVPEYLQIKNLKLMGSQWSVILLSSVNVYYLIVMMRYFSKIPEEMFEVAQLDGANHLDIIRHIVFPLAKSGIATIIMFYGVLRWNEYFKADIYISSIGKTTFPVVLRKFIILNDTASIIGVESLHNYGDKARVNYVSLKNATIIISIVPVLFVYPFILRFYSKGVMAGAIKG